MLSTLRKKFTGKLRLNKVIQRTLLAGMGLSLVVFAGIQLCRTIEPPLWKSLLLTPEPRHCILCGTNRNGLRYHAPCLVNLATGEMDELTVYQPHHTLVGEIAEQQQTGFMCFQPCIGFVAIRNADVQTCRVSIPRSSEEIEPIYFCRSCRASLAEVTTNGYALLDLYDLDVIKVFPVEDGAVYEIRDYTVSVEWDKERSEFAIMAQGNLFLD